MGSDGKLKGKVAIVTGRSRGIGKAISIALAGDGAVVAVNYAGNVAAANETVGAIEAAGGRAVAVKADIGSSADVSALFDQTEKALGPVNIVVHNAGIILSNMPSILDTTEEEWDSIFNANAKGTFLVCKEAGKRLSSGGRIITTSSSLVGALKIGKGPLSSANFLLHSTWCKIIFNFRIGSTSCQMVKGRVLVD
jgi:3-oxoacyl-[acyl-carrier protein] reductase